MQAMIEAIVIQGGNSARRPQLSRALAGKGWSVRDCAIAQLGELALARAPHVLVLEGPSEALPALTRAARRAAAGAALIVLAPDIELESRIRALDAGADATCPLHIDVRELAGLGRSLARVRQHDALPSGQAAPGWQLVEGGRVLAGPQGEHLPLTFSESAFFLRLLHAPGHRLSREQLVPAALAGARQSARSVDVLVSRLRAKAQRLGVQLPLLAVRQWGYILLIDGAAPEA